MASNLKFQLFEYELLSPLSGYKLSYEEEFVASLLLNASAKLPIGISRIREEAIKGEKGFHVSERDVKDIVRSLRKEHGFPILSRRNKPSGYWWCGSEQEMKDYYERARSQPMDELHTLSKMVRRNYPALAGQLSLEDLSADSADLHTSAQDQNPWKCADCKASWTYLLTACPNCGREREHDRERFTDH